MRIGLVIYGSLATISGGYLYDRMLVENLRAQGQRVEVVSLPWRNYVRHLGDNWAEALRHRLQTLEVDVLLQDELNHPSLFFLNQNRWHGRYPIISIVHHLRSDEEHPAMLRHFYRWVEAIYLRSVDGYIFNSRTTRRRVYANAGDLRRPGLVAYPAADHLDPPPASRVLATLGKRVMDGGPLRILFVGNLIPRKGLHTLLEACARLPVATWRLDVIGNSGVDSAYARRVRHLVTARRLEENVQFLGTVGDGELRLALGQSQVLMVPSFEGFGIVYLEAMAYGLPVVATTAGAARELVTQGENGFLVEPGDAPALSTIIRQLHDNRSYLAAMSVAARRRYDGHPTWRATTSSISRWLADLVRQKETNVETPSL